MSDPVLKWLQVSAILVNFLLLLRRWWRKRKGIIYEPITRLKL